MPEFIRARLGDNQEANVVGQGLKSIMDASEADRTLGLAAFRGMATATQALFQLEHARLQARLGEGHPRVEALALRLRANAALLPAVDAALGEAKTPEPAAKPDRAMVYGRVVDAKRRGLEGITVAWEDSKGQPLRMLGEAVSDADGAFRIEITPESLAQVPAQGAFLAFRNAAGALLHRETAPMKPVLGGKTGLAIALDRRGSSSSSAVVVKPPRPDAAPPIKPRPPQEAWIARGQVLDEAGQGMPGLLVTAMDQDVLFDDNLGSALTAAEGRFTITYGRREFREKEAGPDLYLRVLDASGRELARTPTRHEAGRDEFFAVRIGGKTGIAGGAGPSTSNSPDTPPGDAGGPTDGKAKAPPRRGKKKA